MSGGDSGVWRCLGMWPPQHCPMSTTVYQGRIFSYYWDISRSIQVTSHHREEFLSTFSILLISTFRVKHHESTCLPVIWSINHILENLKYLSTYKKRHIEISIEVKKLVLIWGKIKFVQYFSRLPIKCEGPPDKKLGWNASSTGFSHSLVSNQNHPVEPRDKSPD